MTGRLDHYGVLTSILSGQRGTHILDRDISDSGGGSDTGDSCLVAALRQGDEAAFETLVRTYGGRMLSVAKRFFTNSDDAQDAVQDAFLSAFKALPTFDGRSQLGTWLHRIVVNASLMKLRTLRRHPEQAIDDLLPQFLEDGHRASPGPGWRKSLSEVEKAETRQSIRNQISKLPESYRTVLLLRDIEEYDTETVARMLELTESAVKVRLHRARQALRTLLDPLFGEDSSC